MEPEAILAGIESAFAELRNRFCDVGGFHYPGDRELGSDPTENYGWFGPWAWSEGDYQFHFARLLEERFPNCLHLEMPLNAIVRDDLDLPPRGGSTHVDIVISDLSDLAGLPKDGPEAGRVFRSRVHDAFIEVKRLRKGLPAWQPKARFDVIKGIAIDLARLKGHLEKRRCKVAAVLVANEQGTENLCSDQKLQSQVPLIRNERGIDVRLLEHPRFRFLELFPELDARGRTWDLTSV